MAAGANAQLRAALAQCAADLDAAVKDAANAHTEARGLSRALERQQEATRFEQTKRIAAQNGLVAYMTAHGEGHRIGYDPTTDQSLPLELLALARAQRGGPPHGTQTKENAAAP